MDFSYMKPSCTCTLSKVGTYSTGTASRQKRYIVHEHAMYNVPGTPGHQVVYCKLGDCGLWHTLYSHKGPFIPATILTLHVHVHVHVRTCTHLHIVGYLGKLGTYMYVYIHVPSTCGNVTQTKEVPGHKVGFYCNVDSGRQSQRGLCRVSPRLISVEPACGTVWYNGEVVSTTQYDD